MLYFSDDTLPGQRHLLLLAGILWLATACSVKPLTDRSMDAGNTATDWRIQIDNDALATGGRDRNYTGGFQFSQSGEGVAERALSLDGWLGRIDDLVDLDVPSAATLSHSMQAGILIFTPEEVSTTEPIYNDHPYSNLIFLSNSRQWLSVESRSVTRSSLMIGVLGTNAAKALQQGLHSMIDVEEANGWENQISDGGEPTFRYSLSRSSILTSRHTTGFFSYDVSTTLEGNIGYMTGVNAGVAMRFGKINPMGRYSLPEPSDHFTFSYAPLTTEGKPSEFFMMAGANVRLRAYNVLLQGQFRESEVAISGSELNPLIGEAWLGAGAASNGWLASYVLRARTKEFDTQQGNHVWGTLTVSKSL